jgi:hypothetical protein
MTKDTKRDFYSLRMESTKNIKVIIDSYIEDFIEILNILKNKNYTKDNKLDVGYLDLYFYFKQIKYKQTVEEIEFFKSLFNDDLTDDDSVEDDLIEDLIILNDQSFDFVIHFKNIKEFDELVFRKIDIYWCCKDYEKHKYQHVYYNGVPTLDELLEKVPLSGFTKLYTINQSILKNNNIIGISGHDYDLDDNKLSIYDLQYIERFTSTFDHLYYNLKENDDNNVE